jgi:hypothetical protein
MAEDGGRRLRLADNAERKVVFCQPQECLLDMARRLPIII